jgi:hypothetical protein
MLLFGQISPCQCARRACLLYGYLLRGSDAMLERRLQDWAQQAHVLVLDLRAYLAGQGARCGRSRESCDLAFFMCSQMYRLDPLIAAALYGAILLEVLERAGASVNYDRIWLILHSASIGLSDLMEYSEGS